MYSRAFGKRKRELKTRKPNISIKNRLPRTRTIAFENKLKTLEDERASLITVIRLLHSDRDENNKSYSQCEYQSVVRGSTKTNYPRSRVPNAASKQSKIPDVLGKNKYSPLEVEQASEDDEEAGQSLIEVGTSDDNDKTPHYRPKQTSKSTTRASLTKA